MEASRPVDIPRVLHDAQLGDLRAFHEERAGYHAIESTVRELFTQLNEQRIDYVLVGGLAVLQYVGGRNTRDIDLIIALRDLESLPGLTMESHDRDFARADYFGLQVDARLVSNPLFRQVKSDFMVQRDYGGTDLPTATEEGLLILKLFALPSLYREGDVARIGLYENDILGLLSSGQRDIEKVFGVLDAHVSLSDIVELRRIVGDIEQRIVRVHEQPFGDPSPPPAPSS